MGTKDMILNLHKDLELSQDKFAEELFVARQAVSRWENGETILDIDTPRLIAEAFHALVDHLLGRPVRPCQSCGTALEKDSDKGVELDGSKSGEYYTFCLQHEEFTEDVSVEELIERNLQHLNEWSESAGLRLTEQKTQMQLVEFLPTLKRWETNSK